MIVRKYIRVRQLKEGMRTDQRIIDHIGRVLIEKGTTLDQYQIDYMINMGVGGIYIREGEAEDPDDYVITEETQRTIEKLKVADPVKVKLAESVKNRVSQGVQFLYKNTDSENFVNTTNDIANDLMKAIMENDAIAVDISELKVSDEYTFKHSVDVATMAMIVAKKYGMPENQIYEIGIAGLLHDVGKSRIPNEVLNKPARLTDDEFELMKQHSLFGYNILKEKRNVSSAVMMAVLQHHEKIDGNGYPLGLAESEIGEYAKILSTVDIYDALVTERPYKTAFSQRDAVEMIMSMTRELDVTAIKAFLSSVILYPVDSIVELSTGEKAKVVKNNQNCILRPKVVGLKTGKVYDLTEDVSCASIIIP